MFGKLHSQRSATGSSKLNRAILASVAAMLAMNLFVLAQQLGQAPSFAVADSAAQQA